MELWTFISIAVAIFNCLETTAKPTPYQPHIFSISEDILPLVIQESHVIRVAKQSRLSPAPEINPDKYESTFAVINYHPLPVIPTKPSRHPNRKPPRKPRPPPAHLVAESLIPTEQEISTTSLPELKPIPPLPPPIPSLSSQVQDIKEGSGDLSLPPPRPHGSSIKSPSSIVKYVRKEDGIGNYYFEFESGDATTRSERGTLKKISGTAISIVTKRGSYKFLSPDGLTHRVDYEADEHGYRPRIQRFLVNTLQKLGAENVKNGR